jgi:hypothetical protein
LDPVTTRFFAGIGAHVALLGPMLQRCHRPAAGAAAVDTKNLIESAGVKYWIVAD